MQSSNNDIGLVMSLALLMKSSFQPILCQVFDGPQYPLPHCVAVQVALIEHGVGFHGGLNSSRLTVLLYQGVSATVYVNLASHRLDFRHPRGQVKDVLNLTGIDKIIPIEC